jgi:2-keto-4-pentenoate hydratase/2-oxohepta-3-ene-1,7-dioic acid hydratase in catechol pathway
VKFGTASKDNQREIVLSFDLDSNRWFFWSDLQKSFGNEKIITTTHDLLSLIQRSAVILPFLKDNRSKIENLPFHDEQSLKFELPLRPVSFRDFYCFEDHVKAGRQARGLEMIPEWYEAPIFYYSNHLNMRGCSEGIPFPTGVSELDCELEIACIVGSEIFNASADEAERAIFGYSVLNDWSARDLQRFEMKINMGPAKAKDFATSLGSFIVTKDEIAALRRGKGYDIAFECSINNELLTSNNWKKVQFSFEEMLQRASRNCRVFPGEIIASGTMGGGCLLEHNLVKNEKRWLKKGDRVDMKWLSGGPWIRSEIL